MEEETKRALAYIAKVEEIRPIPGYDRVEHVRVLGWWVVCRKDEFKVGDNGVYFEIDSLVPATDKRFEFLESRKFKVKTIKMCKIYSQGLLLPTSIFPEVENKPIGFDCTDLLGIKYYVPEDNVRKSNAPADPNAKYKSMAARHPKLARQKWFRWLMRREWGKKLLFKFFGKKNDEQRGWPIYLEKTDEVRVELIPDIVNDKSLYSVSEKMNGCSCSYSINKNKRDYDFYVCSRNVVQNKQGQKYNIYWELANKYDIEKKLRHFIKANNYETVVLQGEGVGRVQGNPYKLKEDDLYCFNLVIDGVKVSNKKLCQFCDEYGLKHVPIIYEHHKLPDTLEELKLEADGFSAINPNVRREGFVYRTEEDNPRSFKNVSNAYLLKHKELDEGN